MSDLIIPRAGRVGPHRESHEPRLMATDFLAGGIAPVSGYLEFDGTKGIDPNGGWGMENNGPDPTNPTWCPDGAGDCGPVAKDHYDVAKTGNVALVGTSYSPQFPTTLDAYVAYGLAQGEPGPYPDQGVDNKSFLAWGYKLGLWRGYGEVTDEYADWFTQQFNGLILGLAIDGQTASNDFNITPRIWDAMAAADGHDTLGIVTHADGSGGLITWASLVAYTLKFREQNITDRWAIWDADDPTVDWENLDAALLDIHGVASPLIPTS